MKLLLLIRNKKNGNSKIPKTPGKSMLKDNFEQVGANLIKIILQKDYSEIEMIHERKVDIKVCFRKGHVIEILVERDNQVKYVIPKVTV